MQGEWLLEGDKRVYFGDDLSCQWPLLTCLLFLQGARKMQEDGAEEDMTKEIYPLLMYDRDHVLYILEDEVQHSERKFVLHRNNKCIVRDSGLNSSLVVQRRYSVIVC